MAKTIGIDPGKTTGFAYCEAGELKLVISTDFWGCIQLIDDCADATVVVELPNTKHVWHNGATSKRSVQRTGVNVGSCIREAELIVEYLNKKGREYITQKPKGKVNAEMFKRITGWKGPTNQHSRDAALLVHGLTIKAKK
jgi:hypothetical protein